MKPRNRKKTSTMQRGLSLLEVMLAIAILGGALVVIGELVRIANRNALTARDQTTAQLLCEAKMAEVAAGIIPAQAVSATTSETDPNFLYEIQVEKSSQEGLLLVQVTFTQDPSEVTRPQAFSLMRWMVDPAIELTPDASATSTDSSSSSSSSSGTSSATGSSGS